MGLILRFGWPTSSFEVGEVIERYTHPRFVHEQVHTFRHLTSPHRIRLYITSITSPTSKEEVGHPKRRIKSKRERHCYRLHIYRQQSFPFYLLYQSVPLLKAGQGRVEWADTIYSQ